MATKTTLKMMKCPTCGASLKAENEKDVIVCVYCGNSIVPVVETVAPVDKNTDGGFGGVLRVEGIKTSSSAVAYMEQFFEEYDWDSFVYAQNLSIRKIDDLVVSLKNSSADDKNTWFAYVKSLLVPFSHKVDGCRELLAEVIEEYKKDNLEAYSIFDAYKRISNSIINSKERIFNDVEKALSKAEKYGAQESEIKEYKAYLEEIKNDSSPSLYQTVEDIPEIKAYISEKSMDVANQLAARGINAQAEYEKAKLLISQKNYVEALNILHTLKGFSDSEKLIDEIDKYYLIFDILEIGGNLYYFKKDAETGAFNLYTTENGKITSKSVIKRIKHVITNYADILYYIDAAGFLRKYDFSQKTNTIIEKEKRFSDDLIYSYDNRVFLLSKKEETSEKYKIETLYLRSGNVNTIVEKVQGIEKCENNKIVYTHKVKNQENKLVSATSIIDVDTLKTIEIIGKKITIDGLGKDYVVYSKNAPNEKNKNLYIRYFDSDEEVLLEKNIYAFCEIIKNKIFYYIGNSKNKTLININVDGTQRKEWPLYISEVLLEQGGWIYFIRSVGYNSILCKARLDGTGFKVVAADIKNFVDLKNGYLYYINDSDDLVKVRMDGSNLQELCEDVKEVLLLKEDKIVFVSTDDVVSSGEFTQITKKRIESVYMVDFSGSGKRKLVYDIKDAKKYDEDSIYYVVKEKMKDNEGMTTSVDVLYALNISTNETEQILELREVKEEEKSSFTPSTVGIIIAVIALAFLFVFFCAGIPLLIVLDIIVGLIGVAIFVVFKYAIPDKNDFKVLFQDVVD